MRINLFFAICVTGMILASAGTSPAVSSCRIPSPQFSGDAGSPQATEIRKINPTTVEIVFSDQTYATFDFYGENIFRLFIDPAGGIIRDPEARPEARILADRPRREVGSLEVSEEAGHYRISTGALVVSWRKSDGRMQVFDRLRETVVTEVTEMPAFEREKVTVTLTESPQEFFYGGGVQNGRFSHKGKTIAIENQNSWTDGGVASPTPFYWSTRGYGIVWHTFKKGKYDFGATQPGVVTLYHETDYLDIFIFTGDGATALLNGFYQLTGHPVLLPRFAFYQGHLNAYNRDYWKEDETGILFEDGKRYKESQQDNGGIKESLNGEKGNYLFSARAVIDRYHNHDMPLGWLLPNDGYGAGYGQTESLAGNVANLGNLTEYAQERGVEIGLWTQSNLHPKPDIAPLLQRDIVREVRDAGVRVLKTDVAWVGAGYSFGLNGISDVARIMNYYGNNSRPFIISLDGWAGTQRYAGIWTGDQTGGAWEYIRFHIPTYLGSGLSGQPNISSDMDGIFGGKNLVVNTRDFQWKTFTPLQLNMDGWGANEKYPHALGEPATSFNRWYLKLKSELIPYQYTIAREAVYGLPMVRALFLEYPNAYTYGKATQYQFLFGPWFLVAPIYQATVENATGDDIRHNVYLPDGVWYDYFTGKRYEGGAIYNHLDAPLWKLPVFVKAGAIIPLAEPHNQPVQIDARKRIYAVYPYGESTFTAYDDDGTTESYRDGAFTTTRIESVLDSKNRLTVTVAPTQGDFPGFVREKTTEFRIYTPQKPRKLAAQIGKQKIRLTEASSPEAMLNGENCWYFEAAPNLNRFATPGSDFEKEVIPGASRLLVRLGATDVTAHTVVFTAEGFFTEPAAPVRQTGLPAPMQAQVRQEHRGPYTLTPSWQPVAGAEGYEIDFGGMRYATIRDTAFTFDLLDAETEYTFRLRAVNSENESEWQVFSATTLNDPLEFAIPDITGSCSAPSQGGSGISKLFDRDESNLWHTRWSTKAVPFEVVIDLGTINQLDRFHYLPRHGAGNGAWLEGRVEYALAPGQWEEAGTFSWNRDDSVKEFIFTGQPTARQIRITVLAAVGDFGSGRELYVFKVPGTEGYLPGDINSDGRIDINDLTSYRNYTGLRAGDADFEGYISIGDLNRNGVIDAYDISHVAVRLEGGVKASPRLPKASGTIRLSTPKQMYARDEIIEIRVKGGNLSSVNALSFTLPYQAGELEYIGIEPLGAAGMENLTNDRLHTNGRKALYPTFVYLGDKEPLNGDTDLFIIRFKAKKALRFQPEISDGIWVDKLLRPVRF